MICLSALAQVQPEEDTVQRYATMQLNPIQRDWKPSMIRVGYDLSRVAMTAFTAYNQSQKAWLEIDTHNLFLVGEYGFDKYTRSKEYEYSNEGSYWKLGIDANLIRYDLKRNVLSMGFRYCQSTYSDELTFVRNSDFFGDTEKTVENTSLKSQWLEYVVGLKIRMWKELFLGYSFHLKFAKHVDGEGILFPYDIPGYGLAERRTEFAFHYHVYWTIPFRDKLIPENPR